MKHVFIAIIRFYQILLSPFMGGQCRFYPSCSKYGVEAIETWGAWRGGWMTLRRILRCNPFVKGGYDPVPPHPSACRDCSCGPAPADSGSTAR